MDKKIISSIRQKDGVAKITTYTKILKLKKK